MKTLQLKRLDAFSTIQVSRSQTVDSVQPETNIFKAWIVSFCRFTWILELSVWSLWLTGVLTQLGPLQCACAAWSISLKEFCGVQKLPVLESALFLFITPLLCTDYQTSVFMEEAELISPLSHPRDGVDLMSSFNRSTACSHMPLVSVHDWKLRAVSRERCKRSLWSVTVIWQSSTHSGSPDKHDYQETRLLDSKRKESVTFTLTRWAAARILGALGFYKLKKNAWRKDFAEDLLGRFWHCLLPAVRLCQVSLSLRGKWLSVQRRIYAALPVMTFLKIPSSSCVATASVKPVCRAGGKRSKSKSAWFVGQCASGVIHLVTGHWRTSVRDFCRVRELHRGLTVSAVCTLKSSNSSVWTMSSPRVSSVGMQKSTPTISSDPLMKLHRNTERSFTRSWTLCSTSWSFLMKLKWTYIKQRSTLKCRLCR